MSERVTSGVPSDISFDREGDQDDYDAYCRPCSTESVDHGEEAVAEDANDHRQYADCVEDQQQLPICCYPVWMIHGHRGDDERGESEVD